MFTLRVALGEVVSKRILIADDIESVLRAVRVSLEFNPAWEICGEAIDGVEAVAKAVERHLTSSFWIWQCRTWMDSMQLGKIHRLMPSIPIIIHTLYRSALDLTTAYKYGVGKVVDKTEAGSLFSTVKELLSEEVPSQSGVPNETSDA